MNQKLTRRNAMQLALAASAGTFALPARDTCAAEALSPLSDTGGAGLTAYVTAGQVVIRWNDFVVANYRTGPLQKYPYFSHLAGPLTGIPLTTESSLPFPHHRGLWVGCDPLNDGDYWTDSDLDRGQIRSVSLQLGEVSSSSVEIRNRCEWVRSGAPSPLLDDRHIQFSVPSDGIRLIDFDVTLLAREPIQVERAKHSFFALRAAPDLSPLGGGRLENSAGGVGEAGTSGKSAEWCGYFGRRAGNKEAVEGIAVMDHPQNPWSPCPWFTRDYGHLSPSPFNFLERPWELSSNASIRLRYRVVLHAGTPQQAGLDAIYRQWLSA
jgi:hypothetical protein